MMPASPELHTRPATIFTSRTILTMCFWGVLLMLPVLVSFLVVSVLRFGVLTFVIPLLTIAAATFFLPLGFGNSYIAGRFRPLRPPEPDPENVFFVQLTRHPRTRSGWLALLEDADDIGFLSLTDSAVVFDGDSVRLTAPYAEIKDLQLQNAGWRALFAYGPRTAFSLSSLPDAGKFTFAERSSWHLPGSRRNARQLYERMSRRVRSLPGSAVG